MQIGDFLNSTVAQVIAWVISFGVAALVAYVLNWFPQLNENAKKAIQGVVIATLTAFVTAVAALVPQTWLDMKLFDAAIALISLVVNLAGSLFGGFKANAHYAVNESNVKYKLASIALIVGIAILAGLAMPTATLAAPPDYQYALVQCSGLSLAELQTAEQKFDTWYGYQKQLTTPAQWILSYEARVNEFASTLGCPKVLDNGALTFNSKIYLPWYRFYLTDYPTPY